MLDFTTIYNDLNFLSESIRLQYSNFIFKNQNRLNQYLDYNDVLMRLRQEEPIEYVFNMAEFCDLNFYVDKRCLIPRPETQEIVQLALDFIQKNDLKNFTVIDVGTGSGCIILSIATMFFSTHQYNHEQKFIGIDISQDALEVTKANRRAFNLDYIVDLKQTSFQDFDFSKYENLIICSNLPYVPNDEKLQKSVSNYEPHLALFGGKKGDELNNMLIEKVKDIKNVRAIFYEGYEGKITSLLY